jgi:di/tricarboxylate transporter
MIEQLEENRREYVVELLVQPECRLIGRTVEAAGLRELPGLYLIEIDRDGDLITPVGPDDVVRQGDRLVFVGVVSTIVDLEKIPGLVPAAESVYGEQLGHDHRRHMTEAVLSRSSPLIGTTIKAANFRRRYNAAVVAVHRNGQRVQSKIGEITLEPGDTLLLQTREDFVTQHRNNTDFYLVSAVEGYSPRRHDRAWIGGSLGLLLIAWLAVSNLDVLRAQVPLFDSIGFPAVAGICVAGLLIVTRCLSVPDARASLNLQVLLTIVGALAVGKALEESGAARTIAEYLVNGIGPHPTVLLLVVYLLAALFTETITNNAVATLLLPLAIGVAQQAEFSPRPFVMAIALAASLSFLTPIGYQTNLMVMGPGGYRPGDYLRVGAPVALAVGITANLLIPWAFPF